MLDRTTGKNIVSTEFVKTNWTKGVDAKGSPIPNPAKEPQLDGALVSPNQGGATNWPPPTFNPDTGLFYVSASRAFSVYYIYDPSDKPEGWGGNDRGGWSESMVQAIDYKTGKIRWSHKWEDGRSGLLSTAGKLLFAGDGSTATWSLSTPPTATRSGTRISATPSRTARSRTNSTARSIWWSPPATLCSRLRCCGKCMEGHSCARRGRGIFSSKDAGRKELSAFNA